jgi:hypothetical protein
MCGVQAANIWPAVLAQLHPVARTAQWSYGIGVYNSAVAGLTGGLAGLCCWICFQQRRSRQAELLSTAPEAVRTTRCSGREQTASVGDGDVAVIVAARG